MANKKSDPVLPTHYSKAGAASSIDLIRAYDLNFSLGNVVKYVARARDKDGKQDLLKALFYLLWEMNFSKEEIAEIIKKAREK